MSEPASHRPDRVQITAALASLLTTLGVLLPWVNLGRLGASNGLEIATKIDDPSPLIILGLGALATILALLHMFSAGLRPHRKSVALGMLVSGVGALACTILIGARDGGGIFMLAGAGYLCCLGGSAIVVSTSGRLAFQRPPSPPPG